MTFKDYSTQVSEKLYPVIDEYLSKYNRDITNKDVVVIENYIRNTIKEFILENNIPITLPSIAEVMVAENAKYKGWLLCTEMFILDEEESIDGVVITWFKLEKSFVIHIKAKNEAEI
jgi:hypothetical protein